MKQKLDAVMWLIIVLALLYFGGQFMAACAAGRIP